MFSFSRREQYLILILIGAILVGSGVLYWQHHNQQTVRITPTAQDTADKPAAEVVVYVCGAVKQPGVYKLAKGSRVDDAVKLAGGITQDASLESLNLAALVKDQDKIYVPTRQEATGSASLGKPVTTASGAGANVRGKVNINTADLSALDTLPGIGPSLGQRIIDYRNANGPFKRIEDIKNVSGIGEKKFEDLKDLITVD